MLLLYFNYPPQFGPKPQYCASEHRYLLLPREALLRIFSMVSEFPRFRLSAVVVSAIDRGTQGSSFFRKYMRAELIAILVSHVEKLALHSKV